MSLPAVASLFLPKRWLYLPGVALLLLSTQTALTDNRFAIFARESPTGEWSEMRSAIWECVVPTGDGDPVFQRKLDFGKSHWAPMKFFFGRDLDPEVDRWIRIQRNVGDSFDVSLYEVDFDNWTMAQRFRAPQISEIGRTGIHGFFLVENQGMFRIHFEESKIEKQKRSFRIVEAFPDSWLVSFEDAPEGELALIARNGEKVFQTLTVESGKKGQNRQIELSPDQNWLAFFSYQELDGVSFSELGQVECELLLFDFAGVSQFRHSFRIFARAGSGVGTIPIFDAAFSPDSTSLNFLMATARQGDSRKNLTDEWQLVLESKTLSRVKRGEEQLRQRNPEVPVEVPEYLEEAYAKLEENHWPDQRLALAFIQRMEKIEFPVPTTWNHTRVCYTRDGKCFLFNSLKGENAKFFFYGDLEKRILKKVFCPTELRNKALEIYPIP